MIIENPWKKCVAALVLMAAVGCTTGQVQNPNAAPAPATKLANRSATKPATAPALPPFEKDILAYKAADQKEAPKPGGIVFYGSSSIRMWKTLKEDFPGMNVINRGFGGSTAPDALRYLDRVVIPYKPSAVVIYEGDNDLAKGRTPQQILDDCKTLAARIHAALPQTRVLFIPIKPSLKRLEMLPQQNEANKLLANWIQSSNDPRLGYIDVVTPMLNESGKPRPELFIKDGLHMTLKGYEVWVKAIAPHLSTEAKPTGTNAEQQK